MTQQPTHPVPLALTVAAGGSLFPKTIYRSGELWTYCQLLSASQSYSKPAIEYYQQYVNDPNVVVLDDATVQVKSIERVESNFQYLAMNLSPEEIVKNYLEKMKLMSVATELDIDDDDDE